MMFSLLLLLISLSWSLTLEEAKRLAIENHIESVKSQLELKRIEEQIREVKGSILPRVGLTATFTKWDPNYISAFVPENRYQVNLNLNQALFDKSVWEALKFARKSKELQEFLIEEVKIKLSGEVEKLFFSVLLKKEILRERKKSLSYWEGYFALVEEKYKSGIIPRFEFLRARAQLRQAKANLIRAESDYRVSLNSLKSFLGVVENVEPEGKLKAIEFDLKDPFGVLEEQNTTLKLLQKTYELKLAGVNIKKSDYYPRLSAFFNYKFENIMDFQNGQLKEEFRHGYNFGLRFDITLYEGSKRNARIMQEKIESQKVAKELSFTKDKLRSDLDSLLSQLRSLKEELGAREDTLVAAEESLKFATERYSEGVGSQVELLEARKSYEEAKLSLLNTIYLYNSTLADIKKLLGVD